MSEQQGKKVILILAANPNGLKPLNSQVEFDVIRELWESRQQQVADYFELPLGCHGVSRDAFMSALSRYKQVIVHFIGHASEDALYLQAKGSQRAEAFTHEELVESLRIYADHIDCVILNGCDTNRHACAIAEFIPVVIGTSSKIEGDKATTYTRRFYESLFSTHCFEKAHRAWELSVTSSERDTYRLYHTPREQLNRFRFLETTWPEYMKLLEVLPPRNELHSLCRKCFPSGKMGDFPPNTYSNIEIIDWMAERNIDGYKLPLLYLIKLLLDQVDADSRSTLESWFHRACSYKKTHPSDIDTEVFTAQKEDDAAVYALIELTQRQSSKFCNAQVWVHSKHGVESVLVCESKQAINLESSESIKDFTDQLIDKVLRSQYAPDNRENWRFEFILPRTLLSLDVDAWMDREDDVLGHDYPVVIRSLERVRQKRQKWFDLWKKIENPNSCIQDCTQIVCSQKLNNIAPRLLVKEAEDSMISVIFKNPPDDELLWDYIRRGLPVLLWPRCLYSNDCENNESDLDVLFCNELLGGLPSAVKRHRRDSLGQDSTHIGQNLILLWDDKNRLPPSPMCASPNN